MSAKSDILARIREANANIEFPPEKPIDWEYGQPLGTKDVIEDLREKVLDYGARVMDCNQKDLTKVIIQALKDSGAKSVVIPAGIDESWRKALDESDLTVHGDDPQLSSAELNEIDAVLTASRVAFADSGTIALDHDPDQGRRALTLVPDRHICVVRHDQVVSDVPEGMAILAPKIRQGNPVTWISGGSATSDIELSRVEGVHGPRHLTMILVG